MLSLPSIKTLSLSSPPLLIIPFFLYCFAHCLLLLFSVCLFCGFGFHYISLLLCALTEVLLGSVPESLFSRVVVFISHLFAMKILAWNTHGCGQIKTQQHLNTLLHSEKYDILFLSKTKSQRSLMRKILNYFPNTYTVDPDCIVGGLTIGWVDGFHFEAVQ